MQPNPLPAVEVARLIRRFLRPLNHLRPSIRVDRTTRAIHVSFQHGRLSQDDRTLLATLLNSFSGSALDFQSGFFTPVDRYFPGDPRPYRFENKHVFLDGPTVLTPSNPYTLLEGTRRALKESRELPWCNPKE